MAVKEAAGRGLFNSPMAGDLSSAQHIVGQLGGSTRHRGWNGLSKPRVPIDGRLQERGEVETPATRRGLVGAMTVHHKCDVSFAACLVFNPGTIDLCPLKRAV